MMWSNVPCLDIFLFMVISCPILSKHAQHKRASVIKMFVRLVRTSCAAVRPLSTEAATTVKSTRSGGTSTTTSLEGGTSSATSSRGRDTLGKRLLSLVYAKRSAVITIRKWKEEGHPVRKYELNRIVRELRRHKRYKHALEICEWMRVQDDIQLLSGDYAVHLDLIAKIRGMNSAEKFFEDLPDKLKVQTTCTALLHTYVQHKNIVKAEALMEKMSECGFLKYPLPYNHMLSLYISQGQLDKVPGLIQELKKNTSPDIVTYNLELAVFASQNNVEAAEKTFLELKKAKLDPDWITFSTLTNIYTKNSLPDKAKSTLREMEKRISKKARSAYSSLISLHTNLESKDEVFRIWKEMKSIFGKLSDVECICIISSLLKLDEFGEAMNLYTEWEAVTVTKDTRIANLILAAYINKNKMEKAIDFQERMVQKGISPSCTTWELLTRGYLKQKEIDKVLEFFKKTVTSVSKWDPDKKMVQEMFHVVEEQGNIQVAEQLLVTLRHAKYVNTEIYNALLRTYVNAGKMPMIVAERMKKDNVKMDDETQKLIGLTSKMTVTEVPNGVA
ncbi:Pentatricopeptide repeat-containing protein, mitochondrial [Capsicum annuum]|uniref:Pentatricopeptide repeat-containing protein, mitochondrial n=2 Tax=Capsicum annuum TaxID=4072 RepID=A0A1U8GEW8_CAPAN|nr:pentatricopeptide repeat-containing protein At4g02820, mitochondrial isoform X2 [Capsicum annuum]PHT92738.1 Pentatricopeptide repeat-containing protein, mitochondrial [Capsicum annuum]